MIMGCWALRVQRPIEASGLRSLSSKFVELGAWGLMRRGFAGSSWVQGLGSRV